MTAVNNHVTVMYAVKGGSGTTVTAALAALQHPGESLLVDLQGDLANTLGVQTRGTSPFDDYMIAPALVGSSLDDLVIQVDPTTRLLPTARPIDLAMVDGSQRQSFFEWLGRQHGSIVIDAGTAVPHPKLIELADLNVAVARPCYLGLMRATRPAFRPDGVVVVREPHRALRPRDVERAFNAPILATIEYDPALARAIDAGLLVGRPAPAHAQSIRRLTRPVEQPTAGILAWRDANPLRHSPDVDYGMKWHRHDEPGSRWRVSFNTGSGDLYAIDLDADKVINLGHYDTRAAAERALHDWPDLHSSDNGIDILRSSRLEPPDLGPSIA